MASMFKKEGGGDEIETIIGPSVQVEGNFVANGDVIIEGMVSGSLKTEKNLRVGTGAKIIASVSAANAVIAGEIQGDVTVKETLELTSTARVFGEIKTQILTVNAGAVMSGRCQAGEEKKPRAERNQAAEEKAKVKDKTAPTE